MQIILPSKTFSDSVSLFPSYYGDNRYSDSPRSMIEGNDDEISVNDPVPDNPIDCPNHPGPKVAFKVSIVIIEKANA
jgi:hypothetical protein